MSDKEFDFRNEIDKASWPMLKDHHKRGAVFVISQDLELSVVAQALATDKVGQVKIWLDNGQFRKLEDKETESFSDDATDYIVHFIIVQPYVLIKFLK